MKNLFIIATIILSFSISSCSSNNSGKENNATDATNSNATTSSSSDDDASFSYTIDGKVFSGSGLDKFTKAFNCITRSPGDTIEFNLTNITAKPAAPQFSFCVAGKGTTTITEDDMDRLSSGNNVTYFARFRSFNDQTPNYDFHSGIVVNILSNNGSRVTGTFSGELIDPNTDKVVKLTDGKFDIPFSTGNIKPQ